MIKMVRRRLVVHRLEPVAGGATIDELQAAASYWTVTGILPSDGLISIALGVRAMAIAGDTMPSGVMRNLSMVTGLCLVSSGIWLRKSPQPAGFIADGVGTCLIGIWMMAGTGNDTSGILPFYALGQIVVGIEKIARFFPVRRAWHNKPPEQVLQTFLSLVGGIDSDPECVEFSVPSFPKWITWKGQLRPEFAVFVAASDRSVVFARREDVELAQVHKRILREEVRVKITMAGQTIPGIFHTEMFERLRIWTGAPPVEGIVVHPPRPPSRVYRARTVYVGAAIWLAASSLFFMVHGERLVTPDSTAFIVLIVICAVVPTFTFVFALWQGVHWVMTRQG
jgi:hypothetical protein